MEISLSDHFTYKKLFRFVIPSVIMMVFTSIYGVVDGYFVSNYAGKTSFAAINLIMPFIMILGGMGFMIGAGGTALVAKKLGEGDRDEANRCFSLLLYFTLALGIALSVFGVVFTRPVAIFLGATDEMLPDCIKYGRTVCSFTFAFMLQNLFQSFFIAAEKPNLGLWATVVSGVTNMALDLILVGVFHFGLVGAAVATGISQCVGGVLPVFYFARKNSSLLRLVPVKFRLAPIISSCANGSSELMSNISSSAVSIIYNYQLLKYVGEDGVSAYGVLMYVQFIFVAIFIGYSIGSAPIVSYNYGAENRKELNNMLKKSTVISVVSGVILTALALALSSVMANIFVGYDESLCELTKRAFIIFSVSFLPAGFDIFASSFFTALNNGAVSAAISFLRTLVFQCSAVLLLPLALGVDGIWWANPAAELCALVISIVFLITKNKTYGYFNKKQ